MPPGANDGTLAPADRVEVAWGTYENGTAFCSTWAAATPGHWVNDTASGPHRRFRDISECSRSMPVCCALHCTCSAVAPCLRAPRKDSCPPSLPAVAAPAAQQPPPDEAVSAAAQQLCSASPSSALALLTQALGQGGVNASATLTAVSLDKCPDNKTMPVSLSDFAKVPELQSSATAMR